MKTYLRFQATLALLCVAALISGCASSSTSGSPLPSPVAATPQVTALSPQSTAAGATSLALTISGSNFAPGSTVQVAGTPVPATVVSSTQITVTIPASLLLCCRCKRSGARLFCPA